MRYQVLKNGFPVCMCDTPEEANDAYVEYGADDVREIEDE